MERKRQEGWREGREGIEEGGENGEEEGIFGGLRELRLEKGK